MSTQPEALLLADALDREWSNDALNYDTAKNAAVELRRLHFQEMALIQWLEKTDWVQVSAQPIELGRHRADAIQMRVARLHALNKELLKALKECRNAIQGGQEVAPYDSRGSGFEQTFGIAFVEYLNAAIAKAEGQ